MKKVKITVLKTAFYDDIAKEYGKEELTACSIILSWRQRTKNP